MTFIFILLVTLVMCSLVWTLIPNDDEWPGGRV